MARLEGADIVCFSNDWDGDPLSKMHLMRLAARHNRVLWVNSIGNRKPKANGRDLARIATKLKSALGGLREVEKNIHVLSPIAVPVFDKPWAATVNGQLLSAQVRLAMARLGMSRPIAISFLPAAAPAFDKLGAKLCVYHCVDEFSAFEGAGDAIAKLERELIAKSDVVICSADKLVESKKKLHPRVHLVRHGVDLDTFARATSADLPVSPLVRDLPKPVIAFVGLVAEWVDQDLLASIAKHYAHGTLLIVGRENCDVSKLKALPNVKFTGRRPYAELPAILKGVDVSLITFKDDELARASNPLKAREYVAAGLPVISTPIPEVAKLPNCVIAHDAAGFIAAIDQELAQGAGPTKARSDSMKSESWQARWDEVANIIVDQLEGGAQPVRKSA